MAVAEAVATPVVVEKVAIVRDQSKSCQNMEEEEIRAILPLSPLYPFIQT